MGTRDHIGRSGGRNRAALGLLGAGVLAACFAGGLSVSSAQEAHAAPPDMGRMLAEAIGSVRGCYGVELARTESRKNVIMAWFEDKEAVLRWYDHPMHRQLRAGMDTGERTPLEHVPDDAKNLLVIATITMSDGERNPGVPLPISQISIETYQAMPTGISINGRLSPAAMKVPHMEEHTIEMEGADGEAVSSDD